MELLTAVRNLASESQKQTLIAKKSQSPIKANAGAEFTPSQTYRILVVDDNAKEWRCVFNILAKRLAPGLGANILIEFCADGATIFTHDSTESVDLWRYLPEYDLVLLDLYLPQPAGLAAVASGTPYGLLILERIRKRMIRLPVIVWTSSMESNLPARSSVANGFLFKKQTTLSDMQAMLQPLICYGRGTRGFSLLNPFFDNVISSPLNRQIAVDFTYWALKIMDGLHGLDQCYFRFFNDHGGRHLNGVLCNLEKLIRPLLLTEGVNATFSVERENFEREMLWLYVATLCHDTGMFPLPCEDESVVSRRPELLKKARTQHGLRVLALLNCRYLGSKHKELARITEALDETIRMPISLIASYHSQSNRPKFPLKWLKTGDYGRGGSDREVEPSTDKASASASEICTCCLLAQGEENDKNPSNKLADLMRHYAARTISLTPKMDRLCALLRLADGVDIDYTRLPASHLLEDSGRSVRDDFENFKRQVLEHVRIDRGVIDFEFRLPGHLDNVINLSGLWREWGKVAIAANKSADNINSACAILKALADQLSVGAHKVQLCNEDYAGISDGCDAILDVYFRMRVRPSSTEAHAAVSMVAALAVWCEVNERYAGIKETELDKDIRLGSVTFRETANGNLTILECTPCCEARASSQCPSISHIL